MEKGSVDEFEKDTSKLPDVEIWRCLSLESLNRVDCADANIFILSRMSPFPLKLTHRPDLILEPTEFLHLFANCRNSYSLTEFQEKINELIERIMKVQLAFSLFPIEKNKTEYLRGISSQAQNKLIQIPLDENLDRAILECQPIFDSDISETIQAEIFNSVNIKMKSFLGLSFDFSPFMCFNYVDDLMMLCLLNKQSELDEDEKLSRGDEDMDKIKIDTNRFNATDTTLVSELLEYLGPVILTCSSSTQKNFTHRFRALIGITNDLLPYEDPAEYFSVLMSSARKFFKAERGLILLIDASGQFLIGNIYGRSDGVKDAVVGIKVPNRHGSLGRMVFTKEYAIFSDPSYYCKKIDEMTNVQTVNSLSCPIIFNDLIYGVLEFHNKPYSFTEVDKELLTIVATLCVIGLHASFED